MNSVGGLGVFDQGQTLVCILRVRLGLFWAKEKERVGWVKVLDLFWFWVYNKYKGPVGLGSKQGPNL